MERLELNNGLVVVEYSEKANAFFGKTKENKDQLKEWGARFNGNLVVDNQRTPGWIISKKVFQTLDLSDLLTTELGEVLQLPAPLVESVVERVVEKVVAKCNPAPAPTILVPKDIVEVVEKCKEVGINVVIGRCVPLEKKVEEKKGVVKEEVKAFTSNNKSTDGKSLVKQVLSWK